MSFRVRSSKFRHVFGSANKKESCYESIKITKNAHDNNFCEVNPRFLSVVTESAGGGSFIVLPLEKVGRVDANCPKVNGHSGPILDIKWSPFSDHVIASASDDATVKLWQIPENGLESTLTDWLVDLHGHTRRVGYLDWHPTAENILLSAGYDFNCILWNVETAEPVNILSLHPDNIFSLAWSRDGSLFATSCKDKRLRVIDPRLGNIVSECSCHQGSKASKVKFLGKNKIFSVGSSRMSDRQYGVWDMRNMSKPLQMDTIDNSSGVMFPFCDHDNNVVFIAGKGDGNIRYYEVVDDAPFMHYLNQYQSGSPQRGLGVMPKRGLDTSRCELMRFYKLHSVKALVEPISMIVPRKSEIFHDDIYPPTASMLPSLSADEWIAGGNRDPILVSLKDGQIISSTRSTTGKALQPKKLVKPSASNHGSNCVPRKITVLRRGQVTDRLNSNRYGLHNNSGERLHSNNTRNCIGSSSSACVKSEKFGSPVAQKPRSIRVLVTSRLQVPKFPARETRQPHMQPHTQPHTQPGCTQRGGKAGPKPTRLNQQSPATTKMKDGGIVPSPTITTYKAVKRGQSVTEAPSTKRSSPLTKAVSLDKPEKLPSSVKNIAKLSTTGENGQETDVFNKIGLFEKKNQQSLERPYSGGQPREGSPEKQWTVGYQARTEVTGSPSAQESPFTHQAAPLSTRHPPRGPSLHDQQEVAIAQHSPTSERPPSLRHSPKTEQSPSNRLFPTASINNNTTEMFSDDSDTLSPDTGLSASHQVASKRRGLRSHSYRRRRENRILNESSDQDTFSTPPTSPAPNTQAWNENPTFGADNRVDISALDDALHDFEVLTKSFPSSTQPGGKQQLAVGARKQAGATVSTHPTPASQPSTHPTPASQPLQPAQKQSVSSARSEKHHTTAQPAAPRDEIVASKSMTNIGASLGLQRERAVSPQLSGKLSQSAHTINTGDPVSPDNTEDTEMIDFITTDAPDNTLIKPSKLRASMKSRRRHTQEIGGWRGSCDKSPSPAPRQSSHSPSPGPPGRGVQSPGEGSQWQRAVSPEWSGLQRVGSLRERGERGADTQEETSLRRAQSLRGQGRGKKMTIVEMGHDNKPDTELNNNSSKYSGGKISPRTVSRPLQLALDMGASSTQQTNSRTNTPPTKQHMDTPPAKQQTNSRTNTAPTKQHMDTTPAKQQANSRTNTPPAKQHINTDTPPAKQTAQRQDSFTSSTRMQLHSPVNNPPHSPVQLYPPRSTRGDMHSPVQTHSAQVQAHSPTNQSQPLPKKNLQFTSGKTQHRVSPEKFVSSPTDGSSISPSLANSFQAPIPDHLKNGATDIDNKIHVKKVWSPRPSSQSEPVCENGETNGLPSTDPELRKAYFRQLEEIQGLKQQITYKDKRIRQLEEELRMLRLPHSSEVGESTC